MDLIVAQRGIGSPWEEAIAWNAATTQVSAALIKGVIAAESAWNPDAIDPSRQSYGLMQINAAAHGVSPQTALVPEWNLSYGAALLREQILRRPSLDLALVAYNAGTSRSDADLAARLAGNVNGVATYVDRVIEYTQWYAARETPPPVDVEIINTWPPDGGGPSLEDGIIEDEIPSTGWEEWPAIGTIGLALLGIGLVLLGRR